MKLFTLGFIFTPDYERVLLVHKLKPHWQVGLMNGVGGKYELGESAEECVSREVHEECGLDIGPESWRYVGKMYSDTWRVDVLTVVYHGDPDDARKCDYEEVEWVSLSEYPDNLISNVPWLIELSKDALVNDLYEDFSVKFR